MRKYFSIILVALCLAGCARPDGVIRTGKMEDVLYDLHVAEGIIYARGYAYGHDSLVAKYYESVLAKHGITQAEFDSSLVWYTDHPLRFNRIYPKVIARLEADQQVYKAIREAEIEEQKSEQELEKIVRLKQDSILRYLLSDSVFQFAPTYTCLNGDTLKIDVGYVYPFIYELQDSLKLILQEPSQAAIDSIQHQEEEVEKNLDGPKENPLQLIQKQLPLLEKPSLKRSQNIPHQG